MFETIWAYRAVLLNVLALAGLSVFLSPRTRPLNCDFECGESLLALRAVDQFSADGFRFLLLENLGTSEAPLLYTHNLNIGQLSFVLLEWIGVPNTFKFVLPLLAYAAGLFFVFLLTQQVGANRIVSYTVMWTFGLTYWGVAAWSMNALRAWHMIALFGSLYFARRVSASPKLIRWSFGSSVTLLLAFGCGYDYWVIVIVAYCATLLFGLVQNRRTLGSAVMYPLAAMVLAPLLRLVQVALALGPQFAWQDFVWTLGIKIPGVNQLVALPSLSEIDDFYLNNSAYRAPASPPTSWSQTFFTWEHMITSVTVPRWGLVSILAVWLVLLGGLATRRFTASQLSVYVLWPIVIGALAGLVFFAPFALHVYFKHEFPLLGFIVAFAMGALVGECLSYLFSNTAKQRLLTLGVLALVVIMLGNHIISWWNSHQYGPRTNTGWLAFDHVDSGEVAIDVFLPFAFPSDEKTIPPYFRTSASVIDIEEVMDGSKQPDRVIYQPDDRLVDFDRPVPRCSWTDWITRIGGTIEAPAVGKSCIYGHSLPEQIAANTGKPDIEQVVNQLQGQYTLVHMDNSGIGFVVLDKSNTSN